GILEHVAVAAAPKDGWFGVEPNGAAAAPRQRRKEIDARGFVVVAPISHHNKGGAAINGVDVVARKGRKAVAEIGVIAAGWHADQDLLDGLLWLPPDKVGGDIFKVVNEGKGMGLGDQILQRIDEAQH